MSERKWNEDEQRWETKWDASPYTVDGTQTARLDLAKIFGKKSIKRVEAYLTGDDLRVIGISRIVFDDDTQLLADGYHDTAYVYSGHGGPEVLLDLDHLEYDEEYDPGASGFLEVEYDFSR